MGRSEKRELISRLTVLFLHLLKWHHQSAFRGNSWRLTVEEQRLRIQDHLDDNPSLNGLLSSACAAAYRVARLGAARETGLDPKTFPAACPFTFDQAMNPDFWPD